MKIKELLSEQPNPNATIGTIGSSPQSQQSTQSTQPTATKSNQQTPDKSTSMLASVLKQNKVIDNDTDINNFLSAYQASSKKLPLNAAQQEIMAKLASAQLQDKTLSQKLGLQLQTIANQNKMTAPSGKPTV